MCLLRRTCYAFSVNRGKIMCGISALFSSCVQFSASLVKAMSDVIKHRGPDDEGFYLLFGDDGSSEICGGGDTPLDVYRASWKYCPKKEIGQVGSRQCLVALGHRRLSIIDLSSAGHQPMCLPDRPLWITYNGEIYNFIEIREELVAKGCVFNTQSDTEVILQAYRYWGADCLHHFNGMFAFVIYDAEKNKIFAARDRFGVKPLYYWCSPVGIICFASEIKQFTVLPEWEPRLNTQKAYDFLNWGLLDHSNETMFHRVFQLRGGECLELSLQEVGFSTIHPKRWYDLTPKEFKGSFKDASEFFRYLLEDSIRLRLRSDVPIGSCLSGGLDSSSIVCIMRNLLKETSKQKTFSACSHHERFDERMHIEKVIQNTGIEAHYVYPDVDQLIEELSSVLWHQDEPYPTTSIYAQWLVFKKVKENNVKVMLDGQGADEQLGGYTGFFGNQIYDLFMQFKWADMLSEIQGIKEKYPQINPWPLLLNKLVPDPIRQPVRRWLGKSAPRPDWLNLKMLNIIDRPPYLPANGVQEQSYQQMTYTSLPMLLHFEDRDSMAHSVESRTPFLDYRLVEFNLSLPGEYKVAQGWTKRVMREGLKNILPPSICWRTDKMGFVTAEEEWICNERPAEFSKLVERAVEEAQGILNEKSKTLAYDIINKKRSYNSAIWRQITFSRWLEIFHCSF